MIQVTKPFLPPRNQYEYLLEGIWQRNILTNNGPLVVELERKLREYLGVPHLLYVTNGTIALQLAIKALGLRGHIITTPFSYVATTSSIVWEGCTPVFVDIDPETFTIDPNQIERIVDSRTTAILATHCFGNACDIEAIQTVATKYDLKVIYDGAHCFGTRYKGKSLFGFGDVSTASFHSTKLFHSIEGGAVVTCNTEILQRIAYMRNFGHDGPEKFNGVGINGKNSEFHAAMGLCNLNHIAEIMIRRRNQSLVYDELLGNLNVQHIRIQNGCEFNYAYYPIVFPNVEAALKAKAALERNEIYPRRYFYPSLSSLSYVGRHSTPISDSIASRILCLPLFHDLTSEEQHLIADILLRTQNA
ncbi:MAG: DegT/DnrJ/EryC1/StrS family aminotransferase [Cyclobacteriaceae bacterium]|nr:DegT/DnrJ/EryC1/StrS family aminotransferase [Cyclobacteriaceae bacterium]